MCRLSVVIEACVKLATKEYQLKCSQPYNPGTHIFVCLFLVYVPQNTDSSSWVLAILDQTVLGTKEVAPCLFGSEILLF